MKISQCISKVEPVGLLLSCMIKQKITMYLQTNELPLQITGIALMW